MDQSKDSEKIIWSTFLYTVWYLYIINHQTSAVAALLRKNVLSMNNSKTISNNSIKA